MAKLWGWWTSHKLQILEDYLQAFVTAASRVDERIYLDLFAGWPDNVSRETDQQILGSVHRALRVRPSFTRLGLFEIGQKAQRLEEAIRKQYPHRSGIRVYAGDCNAQVAHALSDLREACWAPTFVFVDQFASEVRWSTLAQVRLGYQEPGALIIEVADDGAGRLVTDRGPDGGGGGHGLVGMRERVAVHGDRFEAGPRTGPGWRVRASLPIPAMEPAR